MKTDFISKLLLAIFLAFIFIPRPLSSQIQAQSKLDSIKSSKQINVDLRQKKLTKSIIFSSIAATALMGVGTTFLIKSSKIDQEVITKNPVSIVSNSSLAWTRDLRYSYSTYEQYLNAVTYQNSVIQEQRRVLTSESNTAKTIGFISYTASSVFAVNLIFKLSEKNRLKLLLY